MPAIEESIQVWIVYLANQNIENWRHVLTAGEWEETLRFRMPADRKRFAITRGILKTLLARYLERSADDIEFTEGAHGKPAIAGAPIEFNVSHSGDYSLLAFAQHPIGIDVEKIGEDRTVGELAQRILTPREYTRFMSLAEEVRTRTFFEIWTLKEAVLKAIGSGLSIPPEDIEVAFYPDEPRLLSAGDWILRRLSIGDASYAAAMACRKESASIEVRHFESYSPDNT